MSVQKDQKDRIEDVELFLDRKRPHVQEGNTVGVKPEIVDAAPEMKVHDIELRQRRLERQFGEEIGQEQEPSHRQIARQHGDKRRVEPSNARQIKAAKAEITALQRPHHDPGDEKAGDHEEDVNADEPGLAERHETEVKDHHKTNGDGADPVDVRTVGQAGGHRADSA